MPSARSVLFFAPFFLLFSAPGCALIAGLEDHELKPEGPLGGFPDSPTLFCTDGRVSAACPTATDDPLFWQDATHQGPMPTYVVDSEGLHVTDSVTGITWRRQASGVGDWAYAKSYCDTLSEPGVATYRLPTRIELVSLIDYGSLNAKLNEAAFPNANTKNRYWTSTAGADPMQNSSYWTVGLDCVTSGACSLTDPGFNGVGATAGYHLGNPGRALCVLVERSPPPPPPLVAPPNGAVIEDARTKLMWRRTLATNDADWKGALAVCRSDPYAGYTDWRLPSIKELQTIVDDTKIKPALAWEGTGDVSVWSSTPSPDFTTGAWVLFIQVGDTMIQDTVAIGYNSALCVRDM